MELYAIRYGRAPFNLKYIFRDSAGSDECVPTDWLFYVAIVQGRTVLFDTGFRAALDAARWNLSFTGYAEEMAAIPGFGPVDTVVITHSHFDHIDNLDLYPQAKVIIAREALEAALEESPEPVRRVLREGNIQIVEDALTIEDTFRFKVIGGHDKGSSVAYISSEGKEYVLTGDECYAVANMLENRPIGSIFHNAEKNAAFTLDGYRRGLIPLPCHDKAVLETYRRVSENIARIV